ncbi:SGNH/GDSL hydrolase family protein [Flagellimonas pacifica]|uniref:Lysophospholipase L1 n=1 Tax=Flagellimonas pacifica TaxID=1247520 RepID=A0A285MXR7_9FLAO|nr:SGNH/GDSL hydrolase family protein [Allomuricauda parva]SNZ02010.1 Lysophospholipase L1 [Allomuricauda parva]
MNRILLILFSISCTHCFSQEKDGITWWSPINDSKHVIEGQAWPNGVAEYYSRLPERVANTLSKGVYNLGRQSAGLMIRFNTNSAKITVRYTVSRKGGFGMNHMPATGVSGVDLYTFDEHGKEIWCAAERKFSDTIIYDYKNLGATKTFREYRLYLPLYNQITHLEVGVESKSDFDFLPVREKKPIVVYGTSITQGACASRPGMAWTAQLGRALDLPLINLGFSGSGRLELPMIDLIAEIDAKVYILDCMPNLTQVTWENLGIENEGAFKERVLKAVNRLRSKKGSIPILLVEHAGYSDEYVSGSQKDRFQKVNKLQYQVYVQLKRQGVENLHYMKKEEIGLKMDDTVDGVHPTDLGMWHYAQAYVSKLQSLLK